jgi:hypothetical protein
LQRCAFLFSGATNIPPNPLVILFFQVDDPAPSNAWGGAQTENTSEAPSGVDFRKDGFRGAFKKGTQVFRSKPDQKADEKTHAATQHTKKSDAPTTQTDPTTANYATDKPAAPPATTTNDYHPSQSVRQAEQKLEQQPDDSATNAQAKEQAKDLSSRVPQKHKERAAVATDRTKQFFNEQFPQDRRDQFLWRLKKVRLK